MFTQRTRHFQDASVDNLVVEMQTIDHEISNYFRITLELFEELLTSIELLEKLLTEWRVLVNSFLVKNLFRRSDSVYGMALSVLQPIRWQDSNPASNPARK
ncbi:PREDICTED: uncharacterized protein LOC105143267 [Acromyrmex echinatior]|uniref:uncharacterized protein LOC105143267 n=1 Tax=Acromyrmex echinatior TaxID=103372 RepID=UPI000580EF1A|nr:PREDICTED: uncharacterized protein LOC105143267 [Acromyrmex echinatior]